jgi:hypothetical protein
MSLFIYQILLLNFFTRLVPHDTRMNLDMSLYWTYNKCSFFFFTQVPTHSKPTLLCWLKRNYDKINCLAIFLI